jgi:hypothetical protein
LVALLVLAAGCAANNGPELISASPASAGRGTEVELTGARLCGPKGDCTSAAGQIQIGETLPAVQAQIVMYGDTAAQIAIPSIAPVGKTVLIATVNEVASNALPFEVLP